MKGGPCKDVFETWQACVDGVLDAGDDGEGEGERRRKDAATACAAVTQPLFECMSQNTDYYTDAAVVGRPVAAEAEAGSGAATAAAGAAAAAASGAAPAAAS
jgi:hypothetical protein